MSKTIYRHKTKGRKGRSATTDSPSGQGPVRLLEPELIREIEDIAASSGCELVHAEFKGGVLRLFIDRPEGGVDLSDCERVSKQVSALLDVLDFNPGRYLLKVSSPGLDRELYRPRDWERFTGRRVRVKLIDPDSGQKRTVHGRLESFEPRPAGTSAREAGDGQAEILVEDTGERLVVALHDVETARLEIEL